ncbi:transposase [Microvirga sp. GCM10011540]|uniref:transposase n=1 Tax=Microvirga sp. GCM10011540 TaxID=3317338 RepID=UPI003605B927
MPDRANLPPCPRARRGGSSHPGAASSQPRSPSSASRTRTRTNYHRVVNRYQRSSREVARRLLGLLVASFVPTGPVVIALDDTLERRWGGRNKACGIYGIRSAPPTATSSPLAPEMNSRRITASLCRFRIAPSMSLKMCDQGLAALKQSRNRGREG